MQGDRERSISKADDIGRDGDGDDGQGTVEQNDYDRGDDDVEDNPLILLKQHRVNEFLVSLLG